MTTFLIVLFVAVMLSMGIIGMMKTKTLNDFFLGGRTIGPWVSAIAFGTSYFSAVIFIGFAGKLGWGFGLNALWIAIGNAVFGSLGAWLVLGKRTRRMTHNLNVMTMPEFFQERLEGNAIKMLSACIIFIFLLPYSASVYKGLGYLFEANFDISYTKALFLMTTITGIYVVAGGYRAVALTDCVQGIIMLVGSIAMIVVLVGKAGGPIESVQAISEGYAAHIPEGKRPGGLLLGCLIFMTSFGTWGLPQMIQKFYAIKDEKMIGRAAVVTTIFALIIGCAAYFNGALCHVFFVGEGKMALPMVDGKPAFDQFIPLLLTANLPEVLMTLILLLILSASMSTLSSLVLVSSSAVAIDMYKGHVNPNIKKEHSIFMMRFLIVVFIAVSCLIAMNKFAIIVTLMSLSWGAVAGAFMGPYLYCLFWRRTTYIGALTGMLSGLGLMLILFFQLGPSKSPIAATIAMIVPLAVVPIVSLLTTPPSKEKLDLAFGAKIPDTEEV